MQCCALDYRVGHLSWLSRCSVSCIRVALHAVSTLLARTYIRPACNIPMRYTDTRDAYVHLRVARGIIAFLSVTYTYIQTLCEMRCRISCLAQLKRFSSTTPRSIIFSRARTLKILKLVASWQSYERFLECKVNANRL